MLGPVQDADRAFAVIQPPFEERIAAELTRRPRLGAELAGLLTSPERWIRRRVERVELEHIDRARSFVSLDVELPAATVEALAIHQGEGLLVPVGFADKGGRLTEFDLTADGAPAALLNRPENVVVSAVVLRHVLLSDGVPDVPELDVLREFCGAELDESLASGLCGIDHPWIQLLRRRYVLYAVIPYERGRRQRQIKIAQTLRIVGTASSDGPGSSPVTMPASHVMTLSVNDVGFGSRYHLDVVVGDELTVVRASAADRASGTRFELQGTGSSRVSCDTSTVAGTFASVDLELVVRLAPHVFIREALPLGVAMTLATVAAAVPWVLRVGELPVGYVPLLVGPVVLAFALATRNLGTPIVRAVARPLQAALTVQLWALIVVVALLVVFRFPLHVSTLTGPGVALVAKIVGTCVAVALSCLSLDVIFRARWGPYRQLLARKEQSATSEREGPPL